MKNTISNQQLKFLRENMALTDILNSVDIDSIEDHTVKVIYRTIHHSVEMLDQILRVNKENKAFNI